MMAKQDREFKDVYWLRLIEVTDTGLRVTLERLNQSSGKFTAVLPSALVLSEKGTGIYVIKKGRAVFREVVTGGLAGELQIIKSGVSAGEEVVIEGSHKLQDGMTVRTANHE